MNEFLEPFLEEARELVEQATADLLAIEERPGEADRLDGAFRAFHTLKGAAGIVEFPAMARACHAVEDALSEVRAGERPMTPALVDGALACLDQLVRWLDTMEATRALPADADAGADAIAATFSGAVPVRIEAGPPTPPALDGAARAVIDAQIRLLASDAADGFAGRLVSAGRVAANVLRHAGRDDGAAAIDAALAESLAAGTAQGLAAALAGIGDPPPPSPAPPDTAPPDTAPPDTPPPDTPPRDGGPRTLRVSAERVDALVQVVGELTVVKNALGHVAGLVQAGDDPKQVATALKAQLVLLDGLVRELQRSALGLRVLPLHAAFQRFPRLVREIAAGVGKAARLEIAGDDTEADRAVVEALSEPLLHVMRNAVDHGIEDAAARAAAGKPALATIRLRAARDGEQLVVEVEDDGAGIDLAGVWAAAIARGAVSAERARAMTEAEVLELIFAPGLSTVDAVTDLSGRGVGMDAVRSAVERIGGAVTVVSRTGRGTLVRFTLPFSLMMTTVMTVEAGGQVFGIPLDAVVETVRLPRDRIVAVGAAQALVLRDRTIPVVGLAATLGVAETGAPPIEASVLVASIAGQPTGFEVDRFGARMDVLLKPMTGLLAGVPGIAGTTLTGDGRVLLVLDLQELIGSTNG